MSKRNAVNRNYKSSIFTMLFSDRKELLGLYNAISGKQYKDPSLLEINTLENAIYMAVRNDLSFVIDSRLSLYEHQSTYSPNLPLRMLMYLADLYAEMTRDEKLYGRKKVLIPPPQFIIFYNGQEEQPDRQILRLSDLYGREEEKHQLELEAKRMSIYEYDQAKHIQQEREDAWEDGMREGQQEEKRTVAVNLAKIGMPADKIAQAVEEDVSVVQQWLAASAD